MKSSCRNPWHRNAPMSRNRVTLLTHWDRLVSLLCSVWFAFYLGFHEIDFQLKIHTFNYPKQRFAFNLHVEVLAFLCKEKVSDQGQLTFDSICPFLKQGSVTQEQGLAYISSEKSNSEAMVLILLREIPNHIVYPIETKWGKKWRVWLRTCISAASTCDATFASLLVQSPAQIGMRQILGDHLAPCVEDN